MALRDIEMAEQDIDADPLIGKVVQGRYRLVSRLGEGGMAVVYVAEHVSVGRRFALKVLDSAQARDTAVVERFHREARAAAAIGDEHIVEIMDMGMMDTGSPYLVMELLEGRDLDKELKSHHGPFPISRAVEIASQCCHALGEAHKRGIVHRDIKPENIFLSQCRTGGDFVKILDFGISKILEAAIDLTGGPLTATGSAVGTPHYMSPEQLHSEKEIDGRSDIYSMGVVLFQMLIGRVPFDAASYPALAMKIVSQPPPSMLELRSDIPLELQQIVHRALAKNAKERFASTAALSEALSSFAGFSGDALLTDSGVAFNRSSTPNAWEKRAESKTPRPVDSSLGGDRSSTTSAGGKRRETKAAAGTSKGRLSALGALAAVAVGGSLFGVFIFQPGNFAKVPGQPMGTGQRPVSILLPAERSAVPPLPAEAFRGIPLAVLPTTGPQVRPTATPTVAEKRQAGGSQDKPTIALLGKRNGRRLIQKKVAFNQNQLISAAKPIGVAKRAVLLRNVIRADVKVAINCRGTVTSVHVPAKSEALATVPQETCQVSCTGIGGPACPNVLTAKAASLEIR